MLNWFVGRHEVRGGAIGDTLTIALRNQVGATCLTISLLAGNGHVRLRQQRPHRLPSFHSKQQKKNNKVCHRDVNRIFTCRSNEKQGRLHAPYACSCSIQRIVTMQHCPALHIRFHNTSPATVTERKASAIGLNDSTHAARHQYSVSYQISATMRLEYKQTRRWTKESR